MAHSQRLPWALAALATMIAGAALASAQTASALLASRLQAQPRLALEIESQVYRAAPGSIDALDPATWETFPIAENGATLSTHYSLELAWPAVRVDSLASLPVVPGDPASVSSAVSWVAGRAVQRYNRTVGPHYIISNELRRTELFESLLLTLLDGEMLFQQRCGLADLVAADAIQDAGSHDGLVYFRACGPDEFLLAGATLEGALDPARGALPVALKLERSLADGQTATFAYRVYEAVSMNGHWYPLSAATVWTGPGIESPTPIAYTVTGWEARPELTAAALEIVPDLRNATVMDGRTHEIIRYDASGTEISRRAEVLPPGRSASGVSTNTIPRLAGALGAALIGAAVVAVLSLRAARSRH